MVLKVRIRFLKTPVYFPYNSNGAGKYVRSKRYTYGTLNFKEKSLQLNIYKVGVVLVNKQQLSIRIKNHLTERALLTWKNN